MKNKICIISGPTASGKTSTSINLAQKFGGEIINFDSLLFYKEINIGSAKPTIQEMGNIKHHLIDIRSIKEPLNASDYLQMALELIKKLHQENKNIYLVGGSGFYLQALLYGMFDSQTSSNEVLMKSEALYKSEGIKPFIQILKDNDPVSFRQYHENDHYRIRRAVEHFWNNGTLFSKKREQMLSSREQSSNIKKYNWDVCHIHLDIPKDEHLTIIQNRTEDMIQMGLVKEVQLLLDTGFSGEEKPLQSIGYKETIAHLRGELSLKEMIERINISTRQLAKAQRTWFNKVEKHSFNPLSEISQINELVESFIKK